MENNPQYVIGIDSGGTKSQVAVWRFEVLQQLAQYGAAEKEILSAAVYQDRSAGINLDIVDQFSASKRLAALFEQAANHERLSTAGFLRQSIIVMGLAGLDTPDDAKRAQLWFETTLMQFGLEKSRYHLIPDVELALWSADPQGVGVVLIAGTGSNCFGRDAAGNKAKAGGMSHFFSDEGSGFWLGWEALHAIAKMNDGRSEKSPLYDELLTTYHVANFSALKSVVVGSADAKRTVAQAAPIVQKLAAEGEKISQQLVERALNDLQQMVEVVHHQLQGGEQLPVFLVGSLFKDDNYRIQLVNRLHEHGIQSRPVRIEEPVAGVVNWMRKNG